MKEAVIQILCAGLGTLGFAMFFHVRPCHLPVAALGGSLAWLCYLLVWQVSASPFLSSLVASAAICLWSETLARVQKAPANVFLIPGIVPLLPGGALFYAMSGVVNGDMEGFMAKGSETLFVAVGIVGGIVIGSEIVRLVMSILIRRKLARERAEARQRGENN